MRRAVREQLEAEAAAKEQLAEEGGGEHEVALPKKPLRPAGAANEASTFQKKRRKKRGGLGDRGQNFR